VVFNIWWSRLSRRQVYPLWPPLPTASLSTHLHGLKCWTGVDRDAIGEGDNGYAYLSFRICAVVCHSFGALIPPLKHTTLTNMTMIARMWNTPIGSLWLKIWPHLNYTFYNMISHGCMQEILDVLYYLIWSHMLCVLHILWHNFWITKNIYTKGEHYPSYYSLNILNFWKTIYYLKCNFVSFSHHSSLFMIFEAFE
jgi:hypothetical protein